MPTDFFIFTFGDEVVSTSTSDVSRERSTCFTCRDVNQSINFGLKKMIDISHFPCVFHARSLRKQKMISIKPCSSVQVLFNNFQIETHSFKFAIRVLDDQHPLSVANTNGLLVVVI